MEDVKVRVAVLALLSLFSAQAEVKLADAVISDVQQQCYTTGTSDTWMSWAAADANIIQAWQDVYAAAHDAGRVPPNGSGTAAGRGTIVYQTLCNGMDLNGYAYLGTGLTLWMQGKEYLMPLGTASFPIASPVDGRFPGYYRGLYGSLGTDGQGLPTGECFTDRYGTELPTSSSSRINKEELKGVLDGAFALRGYAAGLGIYNRDAISGKTTLHALTCWGYETDAGGVIRTLLLTDSFDETGLFKATLSDDGRLQSEDGSHTFDKGVYYLKSVTALNAADGAQTADTSVAGHGSIALNEATALSEGLSISEGRVLSATAELSVQGAAGDGVRVAQGGYAFLSDLDVSGNAGTGLAANSRTDVRGETVNLSGNARGAQVAAALEMEAASLVIADNTAAGNGGGMLVEEGGSVLLQGSDVTFSGNSAGQGGGLYNAGRVQVAADSVSFEGNSARQGSAIYNTGALSVCYLWDSLTVTAAGDEDSLIYNAGTMELAWQFNGMSFNGGTCAIDNDGVLYLGTDEDADAVFEGNSLRSAGTTYIGMDAEDTLGIGAGGAVFRSGGHETAIRLLAGEEGYAENPVEFSGEANATSLRGLDTSSRLKDAALLTDADFTLSDMYLSHVEATDTQGVLSLTNVVLDDTCRLAANEVLLDAVTLCLTPGLLTDEGGMLLSDVSQLFAEGTVTGALTLSCLGLPEVLQEAGTDCLMVDFGNAAQLHFSTLAMEGAHLVQWQEGRAVFSLNAPEPTSSAMLLTALAACVLRRRRV